MVSDAFAYNARMPHRIGLAELRYYVAWLWIWLICMPNNHAGQWHFKPEHSGAFTFLLDAKVTTTLQELYNIENLSHSK